MYFLILNKSIGNYIYVSGEIKQMTELKLGVLTQCIKHQNFLKVYNFNTSVITNILLKINAKLNGINYALHEP